MRKSGGNTKAPTGKDPAGALRVCRCGLDGGAHVGERNPADLAAQEDQGQNGDDRDEGKDEGVLGDLAHLGIRDDPPSPCPHDRAGGGISLDRTRWVACRPNFLLAVEVLSCLFRRLVLEKLAAAHCAGELQFFGKHMALTNPKAFADYLAPLRNKDWVVYAKRPFGGPEEVLRYLARYTHRVAISNRRLISADDKGVTFKWKDYRLDGAERYNRVMTLDTGEFIRRFLMHVLPSGFHRIRYYGFLTCQTRANNIERIRELLAVPLIPVDAIKAASTTAPTSAQLEEPKAPEHPCPCCGSNMRIIETFLRGQQPKHKPTSIPPKIRIDTS